MPSTCDCIYYIDNVYETPSCGTSCVRIGQREYCVLCLHDRDVHMYTPDAEFERCLRMFGKRTKPMNERLMMMNFKREQPSRMKRYEKGLKVTSRSN